MSQLWLAEVLYSPKIGYTLVSVGRLDQAGYTLTFGQGQCHIKDPDGNHVGAIPRSETGLYRVIHDSADGSTANAETPTIVTEDELHHCMGHLSITTAKQLLSHGFVTGLQLSPNPTGKPFFCESCVYAKTRCQSVPKVFQGPHASTFAEEVHCDV